MIHICKLCQKVYEPEEVNGVRKLKAFNGYTIDIRLQQFRKADVGQALEFIDFDSRKGQQLLQEMHKRVSS